MYKNNRSKSACTLNARKRLNNQAVWPVIFDITGPIGARALNTKIPLTLGSRGHHDWPVMSVTRKCIQESEVGRAEVDGFKSYAPFSLPRAHSIPLALRVRTSSL